MKHLVLTTLVLFAATPAFAKEKQVSGKTHTITIPGDVTSSPPDASDIFSFQWTSGVGTAIHVVSVTPYASSPERLKSRADAMQQGLEEQFKKDGQFTDIKNKKSDISLGAFKGIELEFTLKYQSGVPLRHHHFFLSDGTHTLQSQLIAHTRNDREKACAIMKTVKKRADGAEK